ncbi:MAG: [Clostridia bacterium]|nr:[FeFe] hydrogenase H-cluster maturation GTPase HydF [Clostridia bacterium]
MSLNNTPSGERIHIGVFGRRNAGKSSLLNAITGQSIAVVSDVKGTTTDPVYKAMELLPLGPVMLIDTPGLDDEGDLGALRVAKAAEAMAKTHIALVVTDATVGITPFEQQIIDTCKQKEIPTLVVYNKADLLSEIPTDGKLYVSAATGLNIDSLKNILAQLKPAATQEAPLIADLMDAGDLVILVTPIDGSAPKGRLILPQQQVIRELLEAGTLVTVVQPDQLPAALTIATPKVVVTDSQVFGQVASMVPKSIPLTSFSILMARHKGFLETAVQGAAALRQIKSGDKILIAEGCSHHRQCEDIGTVKLPRLIRAFTNSEPDFTFTAGQEFPKEVRDYQLVIHCGGCMLNNRQVLDRMNRATDQAIPFTNYGTAIAYMNGILERSLSLFPKLQALAKGE